MLLTPVAHRVKCQYTISGHRRCRVKFKEYVLKENHDIQKVTRGDVKKFISKHKAYTENNLKSRKLYTVQSTKSKPKTKEKKDSAQNEETWPP